MLIIQHLAFIAAELRLIIYRAACITIGEADICAIISGAITIYAAAAYLQKLHLSIPAAIIAACWCNYCY